MPLLAVRASRSVVVKFARVTYDPNTMVSTWIVPNVAASPEKDAACICLNFSATYICAMSAYSSAWLDGLLFLWFHCASHSATASDPSSVLACDAFG